MTYRTQVQRQEIRIRNRGKGRLHGLGAGLALAAMTFLLVTEVAQLGSLIASPIRQWLSPATVIEPETRVEERPSPRLPASQPAVSAIDPTDSMVLARLRRPGSGLSDSQAKELARVIIEEATRHRFEPALVMAVIHVESSGRILAVSPVGALGLMQIMPPTGKELADRHGIPWRGPDTLLDPIINVKLGVAYLRRLTDRYNDVSVALAAYNWGPGRIDSRLRAGQNLPSHYPNRVMQVYTSTKREIAVGRS
ncbi:MAG TPA: lytic transglycosylase domain-containing protein [Myxococcales bacterium]|nr:lytic transglycosylase domain-containing protein [Myxococcales bacterium]HIL80734.1 lytic transglycosylase domain-containing protein [Myxococcales bacterium]